MSASANLTEQSGSIRELRASVGISQELLARRADCSTAMVRLLESGYVPAHSEVLPRVLAILNDERPAANGPLGKMRDGSAHPPE